jgi:hypothetical protein
MKRTHFVLACAASLILAQIGHAHVEADPNKDYALTPEAGPWMIYAAHFAGPSAPQLAHEMALEIRSRFNLPAWVFNRSEEERRIQRERVQQLREKYKDYQIPIKTTRIQEQCAVLVGGYKDFDAATRALKSVKNLQPPSSDRLKPQVVVIEPHEKEGESDKVYTDFANPFLNSFVTRNPTVTVERQAEKKADPFVKWLNAHESFSLLKCNKRYTLVVAAFAGPVTYQSDTASSSFLDKLWGKSTGEALEAIGQNAHNLAKLLRNPQLNFEAYVLHLRGGSLVTIGGFDRRDDPQMQTIQRALASMQLGPEVQMLPEPFPFEVPR